MATPVSLNTVNRIAAHAFRPSYVRMVERLEAMPPSTIPFIQRSRDFDLAFARRQIELCDEILRPT